MSNKISDDLKIISGQRIKCLRKSLRLTLEKFAEPLSIKGGTVNDYERGKALASESVIRELETHYQMNRNWYETGEGEMLKEPEPYPHGTDKFKAFAEQIQPQKISDQLTGYSPEVKWAADWMELKVTGKTAEERMKQIEEMMDVLRKQFK